MNFDHITNWTLKRGSHEFPGPDGGTCINEAAIVAAGFEYRSVNRAEDCPPCFSRVIAAYAIGLNDGMPDDVRQALLLPFVTRLSGTADTAEIERERAAFLAIQTVKRILPLVTKSANLASQCRAASTLDEARVAAHAVAHAAHAAADAAARTFAHTAARAAHAAADAADVAARAGGHPVWVIAAQMLDEAIMYGNHPTPDDVSLVCERLEAAKVLIEV